MNYNSLTHTQREGGEGRERGEKERLYYTVLLIHKDTAYMIVVLYFRFSLFDNNYCRI